MIWTIFSGTRVHLIKEEGEQKYGRRVGRTHCGLESSTGVDAWTNDEPNEHYAHCHICKRALMRLRGEEIPRIIRRGGASG